MACVNACMYYLSVWSTVALFTNVVHFMYVVLLISVVHLMHVLLISGVYFM